MRYDTRYRSRSSLAFSSFPEGVKWLILANLAVYVVYFFGSWMRGAPIFDSFILVPAAVIHGAVWQLFTYLFLHSLGNIWHIVFNMLSLWMFGTPIEQTWGTKRFLQYYFLCGIGAGVCVVAANLAFGDSQQRVLGASGAIYGLLLAYGMLFPEQTVMFSFLFPIKAKYFVMIFGAIAFFGSFQGGTAVSNLAHLGGMLFGFIYIKSQFGARRFSGAYRGTGGAVGKRAGFDFDLARRWKEYKAQRARKKFKVYMKKHGSDDGPWVN